MFICVYCSSERHSQKSLTAHQATCPKNPCGYRNIPWNKGQTASTNHKLKALSDRMTGIKRPDLSAVLKGRLAVSPGKCLNAEAEMVRKDKIRQSALQRGLGGYQPGSGRGKKGWYKGIFCDSSWELAFLLYHLDNGSDIKRYTTMRTYTWENKTRNYLPDFEVDGKIYEIKGYKTDQWLAKLDANPDVIVLYEKDMKPILKYVGDKYGKDYIKLYE